MSREYYSDPTSTPGLFRDRRSGETWYKQPTVVSANSTLSGSHPGGETELEKFNRKREEYKNYVPDAKEIQMQHARASERAHEYALKHTRPDTENERLANEHEERSRKNMLLYQQMFQKPQAMSSEKIEKDAENLRQEESLGHEISFENMRHKFEGYLRNLPPSQKELLQRHFGDTERESVDPYYLPSYLDPLPRPKGVASKFIYNQVKKYLKGTYEDHHATQHSTDPIH